MKVISEDIKNGTFQPVYLLYGDEQFLIRSCKKRLKDALVGDDTINCQTFVGSGTDVNAVKEYAQGFPFFAEHRLVLLEDTGLFKKDSGNLPEFMDTMPDTTCMVFVEPEDGVDKRSRLYKKVSKLGYVAHLERQSKEDLGRWAGGLLKKDGKRITSRTMDHLLEMTGDDMDRIRSELDKLISYLGDRDVVEIEDIDAICSRQIEDRIFDMIRMATSGNRKGAMELYYDLLALKEAPLKILALLFRQINQLLQAQEFLAAGRGQKEMAQALGIPPFAVTKTLAQARLYKKERLTELVKACVDAEEAVKSGNLPDQIALEMLIVNL